MIKRVNFFTYKEISFFTLLFIILLFLAYPKNLLIEIIKQHNDYTTIEYIKNLIKKNPEYRKLLIKKYIHLYLFDEAKKEILKLNNEYQKQYYLYLIAKKMYFDKKISKKELKKSLSSLLKYSTTEKEKTFITNEIISFNFVDLMFKIMDNTKNIDLLYKVAIALKKYKKIYSLLYSSLEKKYNEKYFQKFLDIAKYKKYNSSLSLVKKYASYAKESKTKKLLYEYALVFNQTQLVKKYINIINDKILKLQGYIALKDYEKALKYTNDIHLKAQLYLWSNDYKNALKYFLQEDLNKNRKIIYYLAFQLHKYNLLIKILENEIKKGKIKKIKDLTYIYESSLNFKRAENFYTQMYKKTKNPIFLQELTKIYYDIGEIQKLEKIVTKAKKIPFNTAYYLATYYISNLEYKKALETIKKSIEKNLTYYQILYFLGKQTNNIILEKYALENIIKFDNKNIFKANLIGLLYYQDKLKAYKKLKKYKINNIQLQYWYLRLSYELKKYKNILNYKPIVKDKNYYYYLIKTYDALKMYKKEKKLYITAINNYPEIKNDFYWFLISHKDKDIKKYLNEIKDPITLYNAYMVLGNQAKAYYILKNIKNKSISLLIQYYYVSPKKVKEKIAKKIINKIKRNKNILKKEDMLDFYFNYALTHYSYPKIKQILKFIKQNKLNYKKYYLLYQLHLQNYKAIERYIK